MPIVDRETAAYVAGFFDGEGCVNFTKVGKHKALALRVMVTNTDLGILRFLEQTFGGTIRTQEHKAQHWKLMHQWVILNHHAVAFLETIEPYVRLKYEQIIVALGWSALRSFGPARTEEEKSGYVLLADQLKWLNKKGRRPVGEEIDPVTRVLMEMPHGAQH